MAALKDKHIPVLAIMAATVAYACAGFYFVGSIAQLGADHDDNDLLTAASTASAMLETQQIEALRGAKQDLNNSAYLHLRETFQHIKTFSPAISRVYLVKLQDGDASMLSDIDEKAATDASTLERAYSAPAIREFFAEGRPGTTAPTVLQYEDATHVLAPIFDQRGRVIAVLGIESAAANWRSAAAKYRLFAEIITLLVGGIIILCGSVFILQRRYNRRINQLNAKLGADVAELSLAKHIIENSSTVIFRLNAGNMAPPLSYVSHNIARYGYRPEALLRDRKTWLNLFHEEDRGLILQDINRIAKGETASSQRELRFRTASGNWVWFNGEIRALRDSKGMLTAFEGILFDITQNKQDEEKIAHMARHDPLTGIANRTAFVERLNEAFYSAGQGGPGFALLYLDLDHFKDINDVFGHEHGDTLLLQIAERLNNSIRESDMAGRFSIARVGGDEFAILQTHVVEPSDAGALAQRLSRAIGSSFTINGKEIHISVSIGISLYSPEIQQAAEMLKQADLALFRAKEEGRNQFCFHSSDLDAEVRERVSMAEDLRSAIKNRELELYYQPQVDGATGHLKGLEALIRWRRHGQNFTPTETFIAIAERTGLIEEVGRWAIEATCAQIAQWRAEGLNPPIVGVNVSALQLRHADDFIKTLMGAMRLSGVETDEVELELTETALAEATEAGGRVLQALSDIGIRIAVDDFGTGYSSLQYLQTHPISRIKIAQQFVLNITDNAKDASIVQAIISLAKALKLDVIAEGVETAEQLAFLMAHGCRNIQGYYFNAALSAEETTLLLKKGGYDLDENFARERARRSG